MNLRRDGANLERASQMAALRQRARHLLDHRRPPSNELGGSAVKAGASSLVDHS